MNLHSLLLEREAAGKPVTVGLIGAGKFGTMFLAQARLTKGLHVVGVADLNVARANSQLATAGWPAEQAAALRSATRSRRADPCHARRAGADRAPRHRGDRRGDRHPRGRHPARHQGDRARQAHRHGQRRGRRIGGPAAGAQGQGGRRGLQPRLGRSAGADLRACRLGARRGLHSGRGRQGHALRAALSPLQRPTMSGTSSTSTSTSPTASRSTRRCSTRSSTAPSRASR